MKIAIMQPYLFPYIGYFQLINTVDTFVIYDDVNFIKKGYINRNSILDNSNRMLFSFPLIKASQNKKINSINIDSSLKWREKFIKSIQHNYKKAPFFNEVFPIIEEIVFYNQSENLSHFLINSLKLVSGYLNIDTEFIISSALEKNNDLKGEDKILEICKILKADQYINPIGGLDLYKKDFFSRENIKLNFLKSEEITYKQYNNNFIPWLSIIDVLMFNSKENIDEILKSYSLL
ncbi:WbqC family protein [Polaribacter uvawellassae]|uniref:WbqC family protein n=1 Tax=Polaribacter uvawellassae TaxID=3133495 RepID=UPI00321A60AE